MLFHKPFRIEKCSVYWAHFVDSKVFIRDENEHVYVKVSIVYTDYTDLIVILHNCYGIAAKATAIRTWDLIHEHNKSVGIKRRKTKAFSPCLSATCFHYEIRRVRRTSRAIVSLGFRGRLGVFFRERFMERCRRRVTRRHCAQKAVFYKHFQ